MDSFFSSIVGLTSDEALDLCRKQSEVLRLRLESLQNELAATPRGDKQLAHEIRQDITRAQSEVRRLKLVTAEHRRNSEHKEAHHLWAAAVRAVCGQDKLGEVYDWMRDEKRRRRNEGLNS
jgi:hypothetical protein